MNEELYLRQLKVIYSDTNAEKCYVQIPILKKEYKYFEIVCCNEDGYNTGIDENPRLIKREDASDGKIYFKRNKSCDKYYKIIPVLQDGSKLQANEGATENMICIRVLPIVITYSITMPHRIARLFPIGYSNATLEISCSEIINNGEIGYEKNGIFFPLPKINKKSSFELPFNDNNIHLINANNELNYAYKQEKK